ncbi:MAG TPA: aminotransferase class V-fold PLP-dependent enzyme [Candidatus Desulfaltia sp.]|nr:aminotransferase class V-fold PLP-dependent enzyme [Candidatus Desulfaltia sp.]
MKKEGTTSIGKPGFDIKAWRSQFPILERVVHLANCSQSPQSLRVRKAIAEYLDDWNENGMNWEKWMADVSASKEEFARLINCRPGEVSMHASASQAITSVASSFDYSGKRNKIVVTEADFPTVIFIWKACRRLGIDLEIVPVVNGEIDPASYEKFIDERTLIACIPQVYYQNGFKQDIALIAGIAHKKGSLIFVDAYQALGTEPVDAKAMDIDILVSGNLKYLLGMPGSAYLYVKEELIPGMNPTATGWLGQEDPFAFNIHDFRYANDGRRFDTGTPAVVTACAAREGMRILNEVGVAQIKLWIDELSRYALRELAGRGFETTSPHDIAKKGAITSIPVPSPQTVETELKERGILVSARGPVIRLAHHFFVTPEDIDRALDSLEEILR